MVAYAELHALSSFSFLRGASRPDELIARAAALGYRALALTDECSLAGVVRAHEAAQAQSIELIIGSELAFEDGLRLVLLAADLAGYTRLSRLITRGRRCAPKGEYRLSRDDLLAVSAPAAVPGQADEDGSLMAGCLALWLPGDPACWEEELRWLAPRLNGRLWLAVELLRSGTDGEQLAALQALGRRHGVPCVAAGDVHMHCRSRRALQDTLTAIRLRRPLASLGAALQANGERHLRGLEGLAALYPPALLAETLVIAGRCRFRLDALRYRYPAELVPAGHTPSSWLALLVRRGLDERWPRGAPAGVCRQVEAELALITELHYAPFFLTVHDIVQFARGRGILCQGRGSAANSAVCYCLGITAVDPQRSNLLFERFLSRERNEPPDIDVDFEHERREEVIQYVYRKYGRERAALAATVITYRPRSALRDVGRALGLGPAAVDALAGAMQWWDGAQIAPARVREAGFDPDSPIMRRLCGLVAQLVGMPRHLSQHVGGFVISDGPLDALVPIENATMPERTVIQWDKDDLETLGLLKVDVLALGMLTVVRKALALVARHHDRPLTLATVPAEDPAVYRMLQQADSMGVFQVESRAQMAMLPRLRPNCFYDLVVQVSIVRPGPIQGDMVHPYLARRADPGQVPAYASEALEAVLGRTLGVPIFQEQVMQLAVVAAGFTPGEADALRRAMAAWRRRGGLEPYREKLLAGMRANGYPRAFAEQIYAQIRGFGEYGFPESHAASFALLVYVSAWLKCHYPAVFCAALLNSQPMGFYAPAQLVQDARRHGVSVRPVDVQRSEVAATLEPLAGDASPRSGGQAALAVRLGLGQVKGLAGEAAARIAAARADGPFVQVSDLVRRAALSRRDLEALATADALASLAGHRHQARWMSAGVERSAPLWQEIAEPPVPLPAPSLGREVRADYNSLGLSLRAHPLALLRPRLQAQRVVPAKDLPGCRDGRAVIVAGLVINRQRPGSAAGVLFLTLEDETGNVNLVVYPQLLERQRRETLRARLLLVRGRLQLQHGVVHVVAGRLQDRSVWLGDLQVRSRDFA
ncbi:MAG: error-prone DNA polymerase [Pseudomonadota bacterium]|nr:error-prone DNA polymerase [Pseudomonadota bacterium]